MPTEVQLKDGTTIQLKGDNLTPDQISQGVARFRSLQQPEQPDLSTPIKVAVEQAVSPTAAPDPALAAGRQQLQGDISTFLGERDADRQTGQVATFSNAPPGAVPPRISTPLGDFDLPDIVPPVAEDALTFGLSQEAAGAARAVSETLVGKESIGRAYLTGAAAQNERIKIDAGERSPTGRTAIGLAAGLGSAKPAKALLSPAAAFLKNAFEGAKAGAMFGGLGGFGRSGGQPQPGGDFLTDVGRRALGTGEGVVVGGVLGFGLSSLFLSVSKGVKPTGKLSLKGLNREERTALRQVMAAFEDDGIGQVEAARRLSEWQRQGGEPAALFDIGGPSVERLARSVGGRISRSASLLQNEVDQRLANQADEIADNLARTVSKETDYAAAIEDLHAFRQGMAAPHYERAYQEDIQITENLRRFLKRPSVTRNLPNAKRIAAEEDIDLAQLGLRERPNGTIEFGERINVRLIDYIKRGMDDELSALRDPLTLRINHTNDSRTTNNTRKQILKEVDQQSVNYRAARSLWSGTTETMDSLSLGLDLFKPSLTAADLAKRVQRMGEGDREYLRAGVVRAIQNKVEATPDGANAVKRFFNREAFRKKLRLIFDDKTAVANFEALMRRQLEKIDRTARVAPRFGSQTDLRGQDVAVGVGDLLAGRPVRSALGATARATARGFRDRRQRAAQDRTNVEVFELLFDRDNPIRILGRGQRFLPGIRTQGTASSLIGPGSEQLRQEVNKLVGQPQP